jgi:1-acyl-sn-glycerol-3-phosphate acyltransferase
MNDPARNEPPSRRDVPKRTMLWAFLQLLCRALTTVLFDLKVSGERNVPRSGGVLLLTNHQSYLDPVLIGVRLRRPLSYLAKSELFDNPLLGWLIRSLNAFPVRQGRADIGAMRESIRLLQLGHLLNIFPEGSRCEDGRLQPMLPGSALVVKRAKVPVLPVAIVGSFRAWPKHRRFFTPAPIRVRYGKPVRLDHLDTDEITRRVGELIGALVAELEEEVRHGSR